MSVYDVLTDKSDVHIDEIRFTLENYAHITGDMGEGEIHICESSGDYVTINVCDIDGLIKALQKAKELWHDGSD